MDITGLTASLWTLIRFPYSKMLAQWILNHPNNATELKKGKTSNGKGRNVPMSWAPFASNEYMVLIFLYFSMTLFK